MPRAEFNVHLLNEEGLKKASDIAEILSEALTKLEVLVPKGREMSLVVTKLQEAGFFAKRGMALDPTNQQ
jgi:hypothetical protein